MARDIKRKHPQLFLEVADTDSLRTKGLMYRKDIGDNEGMLFKWPSKSSRSFWMKNTYIPLDIAFIDDDGSIIQIEQMYPLSTRRTVSEKPCKYVIETKMGWFDNHKIKPGDRIKGLCFNQDNSRKHFAQTEPAQNDDNVNVSPDVWVNFGLRDKLKYAEDRNLPLQIIYVSNEGHTLPPRTLYPVEQEGDTYPIDSGANGDFFKAYDASPSIQGNGFAIDGGQVKSFLFDGVIKLDVLGDDNQPIEMMRGMPVSEPEISLEEFYGLDVNNESLVYQIMRERIPELTFDAWESVKGDVYQMFEDHVYFDSIVDFVRQSLLQYDFLENQREE